MGYVKKNFEGNYLNWYETISANNKIPEIVEYSPVSGNITSLDWQGENKEAVCNIVKSIDETCQSFNKAITSNIEKIKTCTGPLFNKLESLKNKIEEYNSYVDEYNYALSELNKHKEAEDEKEVS